MIRFWVSGMVIVMPYFAFVCAVYSIKHNALMKARKINSDMFCSVVLGCAAGDEVRRGDWLKMLVR